MQKVFSKISFKKAAYKHLIVLDIGTTGVKVFVFDADFKVLAKVYKRLGKERPRRGWVEQNPKELLSASRQALREAISASQLSSAQSAAFGITNQRETAICWNKKTGEPLYQAIVWEDARTKKFCDGLKKKYGRIVRGNTGLPLDSYFSASKMRWLLQNIAEARQLLERQELAFGTVDSWLMWNFLENNPHLSDYTNASRTLLFNIKTLRWDEKLLEIFGIPEGALPQVLPSDSFFGNLKKDVLGFSAPLCAVCGDQQASMYAAGTAKGTTKATYGTGTFIMQILGKTFSMKNDFFTVLVPNSKRPLYALEMKINDTGRRVDELLRKGAPIEPALEKIAEDVDVIIKKLPMKPKLLIVDGGIARDGRIVPIQSAVSGIAVKPQIIFDGTALGVAKLIMNK